VVGGGGGEGGGGGGGVGGWVGLLNSIRARPTVLALATKAEKAWAVQRPGVIKRYSDEGRTLPADLEAAAFTDVLTERELQWAEAYNDLAPGCASSSVAQTCLYVRSDGQVPEIQLQCTSAKPNKIGPCNRRQPASVLSGAKALQWHAQSVAMAATAIVGC